ncbi:MAG: hypothetical protein RR546_06580 [Erysipelotrichaceae bacterium]
MKKISILVLSFIVLFSLGGCNKSKIDDDALATLKEVSMLGKDDYKSFSADAMLAVSTVQDGEYFTFNHNIDADIINDDKYPHKREATLKFDTNGSTTVDRSFDLMNFRLYITGDYIYIDSNKKLKVRRAESEEKEETVDKTAKKPISDEDIQKFKSTLSEASIRTTDNGNRIVKFVFDKNKVYDGAEMLLGYYTEILTSSKEIDNAKKKINELKKLRAFSNLSFSYVISKENKIVSLFVESEVYEIANPKNTVNCKFDIELSDINNLKEINFPRLNGYEEFKG